MCISITKDMFRVNYLQRGNKDSHNLQTWSDKLSFTLDDKLTVRSLRFEDLLQEQAERDGGDDALSQLDASFVLMMLTLSEFVPELLDALGGEEQPQEI